MAERYTRVFQQKGILYSPGAPVVVPAAVLLKDNQTGGVLAQIKFKSIAPQNIQALTVRVRAWDVSGAAVEGVDEYQYLDLKVQRGMEFGQKVAIPLPNSVSRSFSCECTQVVFDDGAVWKWDRERPWTTLSELVPLSEKLRPELIQQYCRDTTTSAQWVPTEYDDLWFCACGAYNYHNEQQCHSCGTAKSQIFNATKTEVLEQNLEQYQHKQAQETAERDVQSKEKKVKIIRISIICVVATLALILGGFLTFKFLEGKKQDRDYISAIELIDDHKYSDAITLLNTLVDYKDANTLLEECRSLQAKEWDYQSAHRLLQNGEYDKASSAFKALGDYRDANDMITETKYQQAISHLVGDAGSARDLFMELKDYKDSTQYLEKITLLCSKKTTEDNVFTMTYHQNGLIAQENTEFNPDSSSTWVSEKTFYYSDDGKLVKTVIQHGDYMNIEEYDQYGYCIKGQISYGNEVAYKSNYVNTYYPSGKIKMSRYESSEYDNKTKQWNDVWISVCTYEENGDYVLTNELDPSNEAGQTVRYDDYGNEIYHEYRYTNEGPSVTVFDNEYDDKGNLLFARIRGSSGYHGYEYDENGMLSYSYYVGDGSSKRVNEVRYEYDYFYVE